MNRLQSTRVGVCLGLVALGGALSPGPAGASRLDDIHGAAYETLDEVRAEKERQLLAYLERVRLQAAAVPRDELMRQYFRIKNRYHQLQREGPPPPQVVQEIETLKLSIRQHYLKNYNVFYDVLFVDSSGFVFSTIRQQADYHANLFLGELAKTALAARLRQDAGQAFVDYEYYAISDEPSAFIVEPMREGETPKGWFVLQCAIDKINHMFSSSDKLGRTGEILLVNRQHKLLTESRHRGREESILRQSLSAANIDAKFQEREGHKLVVDYRGRRVLSSFKVCPGLGSEWLLIAKIDEDEVLSRFYREHAAEWRPRLAAALRERPAPGSAAVSAPARTTVVDIDEFRAGRDGQPLVTFGVRTCTACVVSLPPDLYYLGHASSYDRAYGHDGTDVFGRMLRRVCDFAIYPYQLQDLRIDVVAPHMESIMNVVDSMLAAGVFLSQVRFLHAPRWSSATVFVLPEQGGTVAKWRMEEESEEDVQWQKAVDVADLGAIFRAALDGP